MPDSNPEPVEPSAEQDFPIVGIGASAGGLEACSELLEQLPVDAELAVIIVQHLDPRHESALADLLDRKTAMTVQQAVDGDRVQPNLVYVIAPNTNLEIQAGRIRTSERNSQPTPFMPIDFFFRSLAVEAGERAIAVVLSGGGSDGTLGMGDIKGAGGITLAQDPATARHDSMPRNAIAAECVDLIGPPRSLGQELARLSQSLRDNSRRQSLANRSIDSSPLQTLFSLLAQHQGVDFSQYKQSTLRRRIQRRMSLKNIQHLEDYVNYLQDHPREIENLYQDILIRVTCFFRDPEAYQTLTEQVFPQLVSDRGSNKPLRLWIAGCSTGEEVYSIAIALLEYLGDMVNNTPIKILATDINEAALAHARKGVYIENIAMDVSPERLRRFFVKQNSHYQISQSIRDLCVFSRHDIARDTPFANLDLITCRNLLIYMTRPLQRRVLPMLHYALKPDRFLMLGTAESISGFENLFATVDNNHKIFSKKKSSSGTALSLPNRSFTADPSAGAGLHLANWHAVSDIGDVQKEAERVLLNRYVPAGVTIDEHLTVLHFHGQAGAYLKPGTGSASLDLLKMVREEIASEIRACVAAAQQEGRMIKRRGLQISPKDGSRPFDLEVIPLRNRPGQVNCFLVLFKETTGGEPFVVGLPSAVMPESLESSRVEQLEQELATVREYLQSLIESQEATNEELKAANEEILSSNEELQSTNEELQTSKEEMQSANEELATVNDELKYRNAELGQLNSDLTNLFSGLNIPVVMVNRELRIRRFTPPAEQLFNLIPTDVGRPIGHLRHNLNLPNLDQLISEVIDSLEAKELEVADTQRRWWLLRIRPYITSENRIDGAVISVLDIDVLKRNADHLRIASEYANAIVETIYEPLVVLDEDLVVQRANAAFYHTFRVTHQETYQQPLTHIADGLWDVTELRERLEALRAGTQRMRNWELELDLPAIGRRVFALNGHRIEWDGEASQMVLLALQDVTARKRELDHSTQLAKEQAARAEAERANQSKDEFLAMLAHELRNPLAPVRNTLYILQQRVQGDPLVHHALQLSERQITHMARLLDDLLDVSRITRGQIQLRKEIVELRHALEEAVESSRTLIESRNHQLLVSLPEQPIYLEADKARLEQIMSNLLHNAAKYTEPGGKLELRAVREQNDVVVEVHDSGIGMSDAVLPKIFDLFAQAQRSIDRSQGGLGIGLTLVKRLVELHGGSVTAASSGPGQGSVFTVRLPIGVSDISVARDALSSAAQPQARSRRILVIDDNQDAALTLTLLLKGQGHEVTQAYDGPSALAKAAECQPEIVILDIGLPGMSGYEVAIQLRQQPALRKAILIAVTGYGQESDRQQGRQAGIDYHFVKPVDLQKLLAVITAEAPAEHS